MPFTLFCKKGIRACHPAQGAQVPQRRRRGRCEHPRQGHRQRKNGSSRGKTLTEAWLARVELWTYPSGSGCSAEKTWCASMREAYPYYYQVLRMCFMTVFLLYREQMKDFDAPVHGRGRNDADTYTDNT